MGTYSKLLKSKPATRLAETVSEPGVPQTQKSTRKTTSETTRVHETSRGTASDVPRERSRELPTREEIQEFSFRLRDELKVKVQAEVPHEWQDELEELARKLDVKKLELYRFIIGEFLGKVKRSTNI